MLYQFLGYAGLCGLGVMIIAMPVQGLLGARIMKFGEAILGKRDARVKFTNEITNGIKLLKLFAWSATMLYNPNPNLNPNPKPDPNPNPNPNPNLTPNQGAHSYCPAQ